MNKTLTVDLDKLENVMSYLADIESMNLRDIIWTRYGRSVKVTDSQVTDWRYTGLNNRDFAKEYLREK